ncbi:MAG: substrate-binding domain-containing protein [Anaerolineae bacterium]
MQTERSHTIEVILFYSGFNIFLFEMARAAQQLGYHFVISAITEQEFVSTLESASSRFVDGLLIVPRSLTTYDYEALIRLTDDIPFVQIGAKLGEDVPAVLYDQAQGARLATQHLIDLGHRRIAEISGPLWNHHACDRHESWLKTLKDNGLEPVASVEGTFEINSGYQAMRQLLSSGADFSAVVVGNDSMLMGAHTALREAGLRVPDDISLVGFDDVPEAEHFLPGITTVRQDFELIGRLAVEYLVNMIENPDTVVHQRVLSPRLIVRGTTRRID